MTSPDFDELARLWKQEHSPEEEQVLQALARRAGRRAKALRYANFGMALLAVVAVIVTMFANAAPATLIVGGFIVVAVIWAAWKRRQEDIAELIDHRDREAMIAASLASGRAALRRSALGMTLLFPGFLVGAMLKHSAESGGDFGSFLPAFVASFATRGGAVAGLILVVCFAWLWRTHVETRGRIRRLQALGEEYREEARLEEEA